jgi:hypothetical protein
MHKRVREELKCAYAIPGSLNPFHYYILEEGDKAVRTYEYNAITKEIEDEHFYDHASERHLKMARRSRVFTDMEAITKHLHITDIDEDGGGTTIKAKDLAVRNFGGRFGATALKFNRQGELIDEVADI